MPELFQIMMVRTLGNLGLERRVTALSGNARIKAFALLRLGLVEQLLGQRPRLGNKRRIELMIDNRRKTVSLKRSAELLAKRIGVGACERNNGHLCHGHADSACLKAALVKNRSNRWQNNIG